MAENPENRKTQSPAPRQVIHLIEGNEGYGVAAVLRQISQHFSTARFMTLVSGKLTAELPANRILWVGQRGIGVSVKKSTSLGALRIFAAIPTWWVMAGEIATALPSGSILFHCHNIFTVMIAALVRYRRPTADIKILYHFHSTMNAHRWFGIMPLLQRVLVGQLTDGIIAVSHAVADYWHPIRCPIWVVYNGVEAHVPSVAPAYFVQRPGIRDILIAGSLSLDKGHLVAVEAMQLLGERASEVHLWIAGGSTDEAINPFAKELRSAIQRYDLEPQITLLGYVADLRNFAPQVWIALQQRISPEPCSIWVLEAMSAGLPLIASATGGTPELVRHEQEGLLVPSNDPQSVAKAILRLADNRVLRDRLAANASRRGKDFTVQKFIDNVGQVYARFGVMVL